MTDDLERLRRLLEHERENISERASTAILEFAPLLDEVEALRAELVGRASTLNYMQARAVMAESQLTALREAARIALTDVTHLHRVVDEDARLNDLTTYAPEFGDYVAWIAHGVLEVQPATPGRKDAVDVLRALLRAQTEEGDAP